MTITEVAKRYDVSADTLRYYERIGLLQPVSRSSGGNRKYSEQDCRWVEFIKCMRAAGISIQALQTYVKLFSQGVETIDERKLLLLEQRRQIVERIDEMNDVLAKLDWKLDGYEDRMLQFEAKKLSRNK